MSARGAQPFSSARLSIEGRQGLLSITHTERDQEAPTDQEARTRDNVTRERGARRLSLAIDARRRLSNPRLWARAIADRQVRATSKLTRGHD